MIAAPVVALRCPAGSRSRTTTLPDEWEARRRRYFALNWIRFVATLAALALFLAALIAV
jgi:hypothetical protein